MSSPTDRMGDRGGERKLPANASQTYDVAATDLPLSCPMPQMALWNSHPRVYLAIEKTGWAKCPYCGAEFNLRR